jgi:hypothetical protein
MASKKQALLQELTIQARIYLSGDPNRYLDMSYDMLSEYRRTIANISAEFSRVTRAAEMMQQARVMSAGTTPDLRLMWVMGLEKPAWYEEYIQLLRQSNDLWHGIEPGVQK